jgi:hypothetical protein
VEEKIIKIMMNLVGRVGRFIAGNEKEFQNEFRLPLMQKYRDNNTEEQEEQDLFSSSQGDVDIFFDHDNESDDIEQASVLKLQTAEEGRDYVVSWCTKFIKTHLGRDAEYDTDLFCNLSLNDDSTWHVPATHVFVDILTCNENRLPLLFLSNKHEEFLIYEYDDILEAVHTTIGWFQECGVTLKHTGRIILANDLTVPPDNSV